MKLLVIPIIILAMLACTNCKHTSNQAAKLGTGKKVFIYKTKNNYFENVPVILSENKNTIASYPHPSDLIIGDSLRLPTHLKNGFLLDNKGINVNTAFLKMTYSEYSKLVEVPSIKQMMEMIIDNDPFSEIYDCGFYTDYKDISQEINLKIESNSMSDFVKLK